MTAPIKITAYLYCKNRGFSLTKSICFLKPDSAIFRLDKIFFYKRLLNIETRRQRLSKVIDKWEVSKAGNYEGIPGQHRDFLENIEDCLFIFINKILNSKNFFSKS